MRTSNYFSSQLENFDMGRDGGQASLNSKFAPDVFKYSLNYFVGDYQAVGFNQPFGNWINEPDIAQDLANKQLYNGNIRAMYVQAPNVKNALHFYKYDDLNRISHSFSYEKAKVNRWFSNNNITKRYQTDYDYDGAGNLSSLKRKDQNASTFDNFTYHYITGTNKLEYISDLANSNLRTDDIDNQAPNNYSYDLNGRLVSDVHDGVTLIKWSKSDKVLEVHKPNGVLTIKYNALDQKVSQSTSRNDSIVTEYFVYDPSGNVLASYGDTIKVQNFNVVSRRFSLHQLTIYGSSRIGLIEVDSLLWKDGSSNVVVSNVYTQKLGLKRYELSNHLGNVHTVITDRKLIQGNGQNAYFVADVVSVSDYYPFGLKITERSWSSDTYRFGFNGKDFFSDWNRSDYGFRIYDPRKCKFESVDPLKDDYPWYTPYQFAGNKPINAIDLDGAEEKFVTVHYNKNWMVSTISIRTYKDVEGNLIDHNLVDKNGKSLSSGKKYVIVHYNIYGKVFHSENTDDPDPMIKFVENKQFEQPTFAISKQSQIVVNDKIPHYGGEIKGKKLPIGTIKQDNVATIGYKPTFIKDLKNEKDYSKLAKIYLQGSKANFYNTKGLTKEDEEVVGELGLPKTNMNNTIKDTKSEKGTQPIYVLPEN